MYLENELISAPYIGKHGSFNKAARHVREGPEVHVLERDRAAEAGLLKIELSRTMTC